MNPLTWLGKSWLGAVTQVTASQDQAEQAKQSPDPKRNRGSTKQQKG